MSLAVINRGRSILALAAVILSLSAMGEAQNVQQDIDRFKLFNDCQPMYLLVEDLSADAARIGLSEQSIQVAVESRLRSALLYDSFRFADTHLYVNVAVVGAAFSMVLGITRNS